MGERRIVKDNGCFDLTPRTDLNITVQENTAAQISMCTDETAFTYDQGPFKHHMLFNGRCFMNGDVAFDDITR